jgi:hypothetical protein
VVLFRLGHVRAERGREDQSGKRNDEVAGGVHAELHSMWRWNERPFRLAREYVSMARFQSGSSNGWKASRLVAASARPTPVRHAPSHIAPASSISYTAGMSTPPSPSSPRLRRNAGLILLFLAPLCFLGAVAYALTAPRLYSASTRFRLTDAAADAPKLSAAFEKSKGYYLAVMKAPLPQRVELDPAEIPGDFQITAIDASPIRTSDGANMLTIGLRDALRANDPKANDDIPRHSLVVQKKAEMPKRPSHPDVALIMRIGILSAALCVAAGIALRSSGREPRAASAPPPAAASEPAKPPRGDPPSRTFDY